MFSIILKNNRGVNILMPKTVFAILLFMALNVDGQINITSYLQKGQVLIQHDNYTEAITALNKVVEIDSENYLAYYLRGFAKRQLGDKIGAERDFASTVRIHPFYAPAYYYLGLTQAERNNYYSAIQNIEKAIEQETTNSDYYVARGYFKTMLCDTTGALDDYNIAIHFDRNNSLAYLYRSMLWLSRNDFEIAQSDCDRAIRLMPLNMNAYILRGQIKKFKNDSTGAISDFEYVLGIDSVNIQALYQLAHFYHDKKELEKALVYYNRLLTLNPYNAIGYFDRGVLYMESKKEKLAIDDFSHVLALSPVNIFAYYNRGLAYHKLNQFANAVNDYSKVIDLYPNYYDAYVNRASAYKSLNKDRQWMADMAVAEKLANDQRIVDKLKNDSLYIMSLLTFRSEYEALDSSRGREQYKSYEIHMKPVYYIGVQNIPGNSSYNLQIEKINALKHKNLFLTFTNTDSVYLSELMKESAFIDSVSYTFSSIELEIYKSIISSLLKDYAVSNELNNKISDTSEYSYLKHFMRGNLNYWLSEKSRLVEMDDDLSQIDYSMAANQNYFQAIDDYSKAIAENTSFSYAWYNRAYLKGLINDYDGAINDYSSCILTDKTFADAWFNRGLLYIYLNDKTKGCPDISRAGELGINEAYSVLFKYCE